MCTPACSQTVSSLSVFTEYTYMDMCSHMAFKHTQRTLFPWPTLYNRRCTRLPTPSEQNILRFLSLQKQPQIPIPNQDPTFGVLPIPNGPPSSQCLWGPLPQNCLISINCSAVPKLRQGCSDKASASEGLPRSQRPPCDGHIH